MSLRTSSSKLRLVSAIVVLLSSFPWNGSDDCEATVAFVHTGASSTSYTTLRDFTESNP